VICETEQSSAATKVPEFDERIPDVAPARMARASVKRSM